MEVKKTLELEAIIKLAQEDYTQIRINPSFLKCTISAIKWYWYGKVYPKVAATLAVIAWILSVVIIISESTLLVEGSFDNAIRKFYTFILSRTYAQAMVIRSITLDLYFTLTLLPLPFHLLWDLQVSSLRILWPLSLSPQRAIKLSLLLSVHSKTNSSIMFKLPHDSSLRRISANSL
jgi:hypothetical protein